jgi:hypothetical protein
MHQRQRAQHACTALPGEAEPSQGEPCIRGLEPSMHAQPHEARQSQAKARARARGPSHASEAATPPCKHSHASEAASPACMHSHTRRGRAKPRRERGREADAMHQRQRAQHACTALPGEAEPSQGEPCIRGLEPSMHAQPHEARQSQAKARARARGPSHASEAATPPCKHSHASEAASPACMHSHTRRGRAKPRRERGREA